MVNVGSLEEFSDLIEDHHSEVSKRINYLCDLLLDKEESNSFFERSSWNESTYEIEPLIPKNKEKILKIRFSEYNVPMTRKMLSIYAELQNLNDLSQNHGVKQEGLRVDFYQNSNGEFQHQIHHIPYKTNSSVLKEAASKFALKWGDNNIIDTSSKKYSSNFVLSKN